jgi:hypothetical protein
LEPNQQELDIMEGLYLKVARQASCLLLDQLYRAHARKLTLLRPPVTPISQSCVRARAADQSLPFSTRNTQSAHHERIGYVFDHFKAAGIESALHRAIGMWYSYPPHFRELVTNGMRCDYS